MAGWYTSEFTREKAAKKMVVGRVFRVRGDRMDYCGSVFTHGLQVTEKSGYFGFIWYRGSGQECETELLKILAEANRSKKMEKQYTKFSPITVQTKRNLKSLRLEAGDNMNDAAKRLGISRKQLEDVETERNYGCHIDLELLGKYSVVYGTIISHIVELHPEAQSGFYVRPRQRVGSAGR